MKVETIPTPSAKNPITVLVRMIPENVKDDRVIEKLASQLKGMNVLSTTPTIKDRICFSFIFNRSEGRAGAK